MVVTYAYTPRFGPRFSGKSWILCDGQRWYFNHGDGTGHSFSCAVRAERGLLSFKGYYWTNWLAAEFDLSIEDFAILRMSKRQSNLPELPVNAPELQNYHVRLKIGGPLWPLIAANAIWPIFKLIRWFRRRKQRGYCRKCNYDLTGNVSGRCSECGASVLPTRLNTI